LELTTKPFHQYNYTRIIISKILGSSCVDFRCMPEFTVQGRIHYHSILKIKNFSKWVKDTLPSLRKLGYCKIESFKEDINRTRWEEYMYKSTEDTKIILGIKDRIEVNMQDYKEWKAKDPTIETFVGKPKTIPAQVNKPSPICQITNTSIPSIYIFDYIDENGLYHYRINDTSPEECGFNDTYT